MHQESESLPLKLWFARIDRIASQNFGSIENRLRHAMHLVHLAPRSLQPALGRPLVESKLEGLLEKGDHDDAARYLVRPGSLSVRSIAHDGGHAVEARIVCPLLKRVVRGWGDGIAGSVLDAWTRQMLALRSDYDFAAIALGDPDRRRSRSEPGRRSH